jgi:hypothetical protein
LLLARWVLKVLVGAPLSFNDALPQVEARIAELEEQTSTRLLRSKDPLMSDKGQLTPLLVRSLLLMKPSLHELKRIVEGAREQMPLKKQVLSLLLRVR